jgi:hypothetical protein
VLWVPQKGRTKIITNGGIVGTATPGTGVPSNATPPNDGAVTELISAGNNIQDSWGIHVLIGKTANGAAAAQGCLDILIGGATDDVLIPALICGHAGALAAAGSTSIGWRSYFFPLHVPQGKRIAAVFASAVANLTSQVIVRLYGGGVPPWRVGRKVKAYGTQINNARGQAVTPAQSGAAASVTEMTASTSEAAFAFLPGFQPATDSTLNFLNYSIGIGVGAATEDRIGTWLYQCGAQEDMTGPYPDFPAFQDVPAGSRLTLLASNSGTNDAAYDGLIYAVS